MDGNELKLLEVQKAQQAVDFIECLQHTKGIWHGVPFDLLDWQNSIIRDVFGTLKADGYRQYNVAYLEIPKKNGKSELGAGVALKLMCSDDEWGAQVYGCATGRAQASLIYDVAVDMVDQNPELRKVVKPILSKKRMIYTPRNSFYQVVSAEAYTKDGLDASGVIFDELHAQPNRDLYDVMANGSGDARMQPLLWIMTTAGDDPDEVSIGFEVHKKAVGILNGTLNIPNMYAKIYGVPAKADWKDEEEWIKANPSIGHHLRIDTFRNAFLEAIANPASERVFKQLRLNQWVKTKVSSWVSLNVWDANTGAVLPDQLKGRACWGGLDLSSKLDMTAFVLVFSPDQNNDTFDVLPFYWIPEEGMREREKRDSVPYTEWIERGLITTTPGNVIDYDWIIKTIVECRDLYEIQGIGFDPWSAQQTATKLDDLGLEMIEVRQGFQSMSPPMKELEVFLTGHKIRHGANPVLRWNFGNVMVKVDENGNVRPMKQKGKSKIDGVVALINALAPLIRNIEEPPSVYESRGVRGM